MSRALKVFLLILVVSVFAVGALKAYAEQETTFTIPDKYDLRTKLCNEGSTTGDWWCTWQEKQVIMSNQTTADNDPVIWSDVQKEYITEAEFEAEAFQACYDDPACPVGIYDPDPHIPPFALPEPDSETDKTAIDFINNYIGSRCYQGADGTATAGIQQTRSFEIPTIVVEGKTVLDTSRVDNVSLRGILGTIVKHVQECKAQEILIDTDKATILSAVDTHFAYCDSLDRNMVKEYDRFCGKNYFDHSAVASEVPVWSQQRVNEEANRDIDHHVWNVIDDICNGYYERSYKMVFQDCRDLFLVDDTLAMPAKKTTLKYYDDSEFQDYKDYGDENQKQKILEQKLQEKIQQAYREYQAAK